MADTAEKKYKTDFIRSIINKRHSHQVVMPFVLQPAAVIADHLSGQIW